MKSLSKFYGSLLVVSLSLNLFAQNTNKTFTKATTNIIDLSRPYHGNVKPPKFSGVVQGIQRYVMDKFSFTQKEIDNGAKGEVVIWIYIERGGSISQTRFDKNTYSAYGDRVRGILRYLARSSASECGSGFAIDYQRTTGATIGNLGFITNEYS